VFNKPDCSKPRTVSLKESPGHSLSSYGLNGIPIPPTLENNENLFTIGNCHISVDCGN
jgi:hypothetical protein